MGGPNEFGVFAMNKVGEQNEEFWMLAIGLDHACKHWINRMIIRQFGLFFVEIIPEALYDLRVVKKPRGRNL